VTFGITISGRANDLEGIESIVGLTINTVPLRVKIDLEMTLQELCRQLQIDTRKGEQYGYLSLNEMQKHANLISGEKLFEAIFTFENYPHTCLEEIAPCMPRITKQEVIERREHALSCVIIPGKKMHIVLTSTSLQCNDNAINHIMNHFVYLLESSVIATNEKKVLKNISLVLPVEKMLQLVSWNRTEVDLTKNETIIKLFENQVIKSPNQIAVLFENNALSYDEFNQKANQLANYLVENGVKPGSLVGVALFRSTEMIITILAILKAGGGYVPFDVSYPIERLNYMIIDSQVSLIITHSNVEDILPANYHTQFIKFDEIAPMLPQYSASDSTIDVDPESLAYVIYTSGTTGKPKGVMIQHKSVHNLLVSMNALYQFNKDESFIHNTSFSFDPSVWGLFWPLINGAQLILTNEESITTNLKDFCELIVNYNVKVLHAGPTLLQLLTELDEFKKCTRVDLIIGGGEAWQSSTLIALRKIIPTSKICNVYGPTEGTIHTTAHMIEENEIVGNAPISIGCPIQNTQIFILNNSLQIIPIGLIGEIYIGGIGVAKGYLNQPKLTQEKFIDNPWSEGKLYKTGDCARYLPDGKIEFLGRIDDQFKVRGYRIEAGEIESALNDNPNVQQSVVLNKEKQLFACVVLNSSVEGDLIEENASYPALLRTYLSNYLPDYMVPKFYIFLDKFPLTANGKIDRKKLIDLSENLQHRADEKYVAPRNNIEKLLIEAWSEVLQQSIASISVFDDFFALGGDSIVSIRLRAKAKQMGINFSIQDIFDYRTVEGLSKIACFEESSVKTGPHEQKDIEGEVILTPIFSWFAHQNMQKKDHYNQAMRYRVNKKIDIDTFEKTINFLLAHHDALRLCLRENENNWNLYQEKNIKETTRLTIVQLKELAPETREHILIEKAQIAHRNLNIRQGFLFQAVVGIADNQSEIILIIHHIAVDGVSWRVLAEDMIMIYEQIEKKQQVILPQKTTSFKDWSIQFLSYAENLKEKEKRYWMEVLATTPCQLPVDKNPKLHCTLNETYTIKTVLSTKQTFALLKNVHQAYHTEINDILLTALAYQIKDWSKQEKISLMLEGHGREDVIGVDVGRTIGWFTSFYPIHLMLPEHADHDYGIGIKLIKEKLREISDHGVGYGAYRYLNEEGKKHIETNNVNLPEITFNYLGQLENKFSIDDQKKNRWELVTDNVGDCFSPDTCVESSIAINGYVSAGKLYLYWTYRTDCFEQKTIETIAKRYKVTLEKIIDYCQIKNNNGYTPSDFRLAKIEQENLDKIVEKHKNLSEIIDRLYPLSPLQEGLLYTAIKNPESDRYLVQSVYELTGKLDTTILQSAWQYVVDQYAVLRTGFIWEDVDQSLQYVIKHKMLDWQIYDWSAIPKEQEDLYLEKYLALDRRSLFDLHQSHLMRVRLIHWDNSNKHTLIWTLHHILADGWSMPLILRDVWSAYEQIYTNKIVSLPYCFHYEKYIEWLQNQDKQAAENYWKEYLSGISLNQINFTGKDLRHFIQSDTVVKEVFYEAKCNIEEDLTQKLQFLAKDCDVTLNTLLQAVWTLLVSACSSTKEIIFGITVSGRSNELAGIESMVGLFINTLPLRVNLNSKMTLRELCAKLQLDTRKAEQFSYSSLADIQKYAGLISGEQLFDATFTFENYPDMSLAEISTNMPNITNERGIERREYNLSCLITPGKRLHVVLTSASLQCSESQIHRLMNQFKALLKNCTISNDKHKLIKEISLVSPREKRLQLVTWSRAQLDLVKYNTIVKAFEMQVKKTPHRIAVIFENQELTYNELNQRANQLAHYLQKKGVKIETLVGLALERSCEFIISMLGILKSGGAYVPFDLSYPLERLSYMLDDAKVALVITHSKSESSLPTNDFIQLIYFDKISSLLEQYSKENLDVIIEPQNLAYIIYTSGTTGKPKGVMLEHKGVCNLSVAQHQFLSITPEDRIGQFASAAFDAMVFEWSGSLLTGATLLLIPSIYRQDPEALFTYIKDQGISLITLPPSFVAQLKPDAFQGLRTLILAGESLTREILEKAPITLQIINAYGPTETTVCASMHKIDNCHTLQTIGRPIHGFNLYILNSFFQLLPLGAVGELYIGGIGMARGYLKNMQLTNECFIQNPFGEGLLYKTGDKARYQPDGNIEFLGRVDNQIKIRGHRIELHEIEAVLCTYSVIQQAAVLLKEDQLVAYIIVKISENSPSIFSEEDQLISSPVTSHLDLIKLRQHLSRYLPVYMLPQHYVVLEQLPLTIHGKINYKALSMLNNEEQLLLNEGNYLQTQHEWRLAQIWSEVLPITINQLRKETDFFEAGGHSLLATRLRSKIYQIFKLEVPLTALFKFARLYDQAEMIAKLEFDHHDIGIPAIVSIARDKAIPLSYAQQRLLFIEQLIGESGLYNSPYHTYLKGNLNETALEHAFDWLVARHEILRTRLIITEAGEGEQIIEKTTHYKIEKINLKNKRVSKQELLQTVEEFSFKPFNLGKEVLFRARLITLSNDEHILGIVAHHSIWDGWSLKILCQELSIVYREFCEGNISTLMPLSIQYADYALWQRSWLTGNILDKQLSYWKKQLEGITGILPFPTDYQRPKVLTYRGSVVKQRLGKSLTQAVKAFNHKEGLTLFMTLLGVLQLLLSRYTGEIDILIGSPIANRQYAVLEDLIGFFVNTVVFRANCKNSATVSEFFNQIKQITLDAYSHQDVPFEQLVEHLALKRQTNRAPIFQVKLALQNMGAITLDLQNLDLEPIELNQRYSQLDISLDVIEIKDDIFLMFEYSTDLFSEKTIEQFAKHYLTLLTQVVFCANHNRLASLNFLTLEEIAQFSLWNKTESLFTDNKAINTLFEEQVARTPNNTALIFNNKKMTYIELNQKANQLAYYLKEKNVKAESLISIILERSFELAIAIIAILKTGGAYVPVDPNNPKERLNYLLNDCDAQLVITHSNLCEILPEKYCGEFIYIDNLEDTLIHYSLSNLPAVAKPENLAYVIYTSGTTGNPKGVMIEQKSVINLLESINKNKPIQPKESFIHNVSFSFDPSVWILFWPLLNGGNVIITNEHENKDAVALCKMICKYDITMFHAGPSLLQLMLAADEFLDCQKLQLIMGGGEAWSSLLIQQLWAKLPNCHIYNLYGPTEATIHATTFLIKPENKNLYFDIPIGYPIENTKIYILNEELQQVPIGIPGELYIGGMGLARGYLNQPQLSKEHFICNNFNEDRLYKTGDKARYLTDGNIEFLGRIDNQIKIRGYRIELGEIEKTLVANLQIEQAIVLVKNEQLIAYVICKIDKNTNSYLTTPKELNLCLNKTLPNYMLPQGYVFLQKYPLTNNGKIDKNLLLALKEERLFLEDDVLQTPHERQLAEIWSNLLLLSEETLNKNADFFEIGGHSLLVMRLGLMIQKIFNIEISLVTLFDNPSLMAQAEIIKDLQLSSISSKIPAIKVMSRDIPIPLSYAQERLWFIAQLEGESGLYNSPFSVGLNGSLNKEILEKSFYWLMTRHEILRTQILMNEKGEGFQVIRNPEFFTIEFINAENHKTKVRKKVENLVEEFAFRSFKLEKENLIRVQLIKMTDKKHILTLAMHHSISDEWSMQILSSELGNAYNAFIEGKQPSLPPLTIQYADYAQWQRSWLTGSILEEQLNYWKKQLSDIQGVPPLPTDYPRPETLSYKGGFIQKNLGEELTQKLKAFSVQEGLTLFMTALGTLQLLLSRYSGEKDILIGTPIANRQDIALESLIGFFVNTLVLRTECDEQKTVREYFKTVRETTLEAYTHQDIPFEKLVEHLNIERKLNQHPLFQVMLVIQNLEASGLNLNGLETEPFEIKNGYSKFDLSMVVVEAENDIAISIEYMQDLFKETTIEHMLGHYIELITNIMCVPERNLSSVEMLTREERQQQIINWNKTTVNFPKDKTLAELFEIQVKKTPKHFAVSFEGQLLSYEELNHKANQLAHYLKTNGVKKETIVGVALERSLEMVISLLAILKAGGAYVPLDVNNPKKRIQHILEDTKTKYVLTQEIFLEKLPNNYGEKYLLLDVLEAVLIEQPKANVELIAMPQSLAYVIYTSGTTGRPKGVMNEQQGVVNRILWMQKEFQLMHQDVVLQKTPFVFDVSVWEFFWPLFTGAKLVIAAPDVHKDPIALAQLIEKEKVSVAHFVPSMLSVFISSEQSLQNDCSSLRLLFSSGEMLPYKTKQQCLEHLPTAQLYNLYGPTEAAIDVSYWHCQLSDDFMSVPIGKPIANIQLYIVDGYSRPVPVGVTGELCIGGIGVARGYLNQPELTGEKFIENPFGEGRLYRTGDRARYLPDSNIEFLGRLDNQIKIRGYRIELSEIEAALNQHPQIKQAVVLVKEDANTEKKLTSYIILHARKNLQESMISSNVLYEYLTQTLPNYMLPQSYIFLDEMPLSKNGKLDINALLILKDKGLITTNDATLLQTQYEWKLASIWSGVLSIPESQLSKTSNFFALGGHSLLAMQLKLRIYDIFNVDLPLKILFEFPCIEKQAKAIAKIELSSKGYQIPLLSSIVRSSPIPLSYAQQRLCFIEQLIGESSLYNFPVAFYLKGRLNKKALQSSFDWLLIRHEVLHTRLISNAQTESEQIIELLDMCAVKYVDLTTRNLAKQETTINEIIEKFSFKPFVLNRDTLFRVQLLKLADEEYIVNLVMHHAIFDGWSMQILSSELGNAYNAFIEGKQPSLPPLTIQYADYAQWQRSWLTGSILEEQLNYWKKQLSDIQGVPPLPTDYPRPETLSYKGGFIQKNLGEELTQKLKAFSVQEGLTLFMTALGTLQLLLSRLQW
jgi:amino acid adenylation domain-containing protein/non-ribosomal peptide synthase protein (TIGR01720 family)